MSVGQGIDLVWWFQEAVVSLYTQKVATPLLVAPPPEKPKILKLIPTR